MDDSSWLIDPSRLPQPVALRIPGVVYEHLEILSRHTGRPLEELAEHFISLSIGKC
jgi:hypothetical protein